MKKLMINTSVCDTREVAEETLSSYESVTINAGALITSDRSKDLLARYPVRINAGSTINLPEGEDIKVQTVNGRYEIGPGTDGNGAFLFVNGRLTIADGSLEAVKSFRKIFVNGRTVMPRSFKGAVTNIEQNGRTEFYPDGAFLMKGDTEVDDLFTARASAKLYYCPGTLFFLDTGLDTGRIEEKDLRFSAKKAVIAESLLDCLIARIDEETEIVRVPDGTALIDDDLELKPRTIRRYGKKLYVDGDVTIMDEEALSELEYLHADGDVKISKELEEAFEKIDSEYDELKVIDPDKGLVSDLPSVRIGTSMLRKYPDGVTVEDCAKVTIADELSPDDILEKITIKDCAVVYCSEEQEDAVNAVVSDVAYVKIRKDGEDSGGIMGAIGDALGELRDSNIINATEYKL